MKINIENLNIYICPSGCISETPKETVSEEFNTSGYTSKWYPNDSAPDGIYIATKDKCWKKEYVNDIPKYEPIRGVAVINGDHKIVVHPKGSEKDIVLLESGKKSSLKQFNDYSEGVKDFNGFKNTEELLKLDSLAAQYCKKIGKEWYIPSFGEMSLLFGCKPELDYVLSLIGEPLSYGWHWMSTRKSDSCNFVFNWIDGYWDYSGQSDCNRVRPVSALL